MSMALPTSALARPPAAGVSQPLGARLQRFFAHAESARAIGKHYLMLMPEESSLNHLTALICRTPENYVHFAETNTDKLRMLLAAQQREDFTNGRVVMVHGWILSETEARLCAIASLA